MLVGASDRGVLSLYFAVLLSRGLSETTSNQAQSQTIKIQWIRMKSIRSPAALRCGSETAKLHQIVNECLIVYDGIKLSLNSFCSELHIVVRIRALSWFEFESRSARSVATLIQTDNYLIPSFTS